MLITVRPHVSATGLAGPIPPDTGVRDRRRVRAAVVVALAAAAFYMTIAGSAQALENGIGRTPWMGYQTWNAFGCNYNESTIKAQADAMVSMGLKAAGYRYLVIEECNFTSRDANGNLVANPSKFPSGLASLVNYIHNDGLLAGTYTDVGATTCAGYVGSYGHESQDAQSFANWGFDFVEEDSCNLPSGETYPGLYGRMRDGLAATGRKILFYPVAGVGSPSEPGSNPWDFQPAFGNAWRTTDDLTKNETWGGVLSNFDGNSTYWDLSGPGGYNDADQMIVGDGFLTPTEEQTHFALWSIAGSPLGASTDLTKISSASLSVLTNQEIIALGQDPLGIEATLASQPASGLQVWAKPLVGFGSRGVLLLNRTSSAANITVNWSDLGIAGPATVRDLENHTNLGSFSTSYTANVPSHGVFVLRVNATGPGTTGDYLGLDRPTQGNWKGTYGADGYLLAGDNTSNPSYVTPSITGASGPWTWASSTTDPRALQKANANDRIAAAWYSAGSFTINLPFTDSNYHQVSFYINDWDTNARREQFQIQDARTGAILDSRSLQVKFDQGEYLKFDLRGNVNVVIRATAGANAVLSGIFFDPPASNTFDDSATGTGLDQFNYSSGWTNAHGTDAAQWNGTESFNNTTGATATFKFAGVGVNVYGILGQNTGYAGLQICDSTGNNCAPQVVVDTYRDAKLANVLLWESNPLTYGTYTVKMTVIGQHNPSSSDNYVSLDRIDVLQQ